MTVTIHDVAREAGVSIKTVSRAMNNHPDVSGSTRDAVREVARALNYRPNPAARGLRTGSTGMLALLAPDLLNPHFAELARHLQAITRAEGTLSVLSSYDLLEPDAATASVRSFIEHRVDGLVWMAEAIPDSAVEVLVAAKLPTVISGGTIPDGVNHIRTVRGGLDPAAYERATYAAIEYLLSLGHQSFAYVAEAPHVAGVQARIAGFRGALLDHGVPLADGRVLTETQSVVPNSEFGYQATSQLLASGNRPTAICASSDMVAMGVLRALHEHGLVVPGDVSVVGHDGIAHAAYTVPPLTTLQTPYEAWCRTALALLRHLIEPSAWPEPVCTEEFTLVVRQSTGPAPAIVQSGRRQRHVP
jgi:LacI family transcriptional regulator